MPKKPIVLQASVLPLIAAIVISSATSGITLKESSPDLKLEQIKAEKVEKIRSLEKFFDGYTSPLKANSKTFVEVAEKYGLDYRLLPAISCMESSCGKLLIEGSYNPFGWGIYGNQAIYFKDYDEAIDTVGKGLKENYLARGLNTPEKIAPIYTPPNHVNWLNGVTFFIKKINTVDYSI